jgi:hypothetical protein
MHNRIDTSNKNYPDKNQIEFRNQHKYFLADLSTKIEAQHVFHDICNQLAALREQNDEESENKLYDSLIKSGNFNADIFSHPDIFFNNDKHIDQLFELITDPDNFLCFASDHKQRKAIAYFKPEQIRFILNNVVMPNNFQYLIHNFIDLKFWHEHCIKHLDILDKMINQIVDSEKFMPIIQLEENLIYIAQDKNITKDQKGKLFAQFKLHSAMLINEKYLHNLCVVFKDYIDQILDDVLTPEKMHMLASLFTHMYSFNHTFNEKQRRRIYDFALEPENFNIIISSTTIHPFSLSCEDIHHKKKLFSLLIYNFNHLVFSRDLLQQLGEVFPGYDFIFNQPTLNQARFEVKKILPEEDQYANAAINHFFVVNLKMNGDIANNVASFWGSAKRTVAGKIASTSKPVAEKSLIAWDKTYKENVMLKR